VEVTHRDIADYLWYQIGLSHVWLKKWVHPFIEQSCLGSTFNLATTHAAIERKWQRTEQEKAQVAIDAAYKLPGDCLMSDKPMRMLIQHITEQTADAVLVD
jgi:hypothetical protein